MKKMLRDWLLVVGMRQNKKNHNTKLSTSLGETVDVQKGDVERRGEMWGPVCWGGGGVRVAGSVGLVERD